MNVSVSGLVRDGSGIGVLQRMLYPRLTDLGVTLDVLPTRDLGSGSLVRMRGVLTGLTSEPTGDAFLSLVSPVPARIARPMVAFVHDVRWRRTRRTIPRAYRHLDFARTMRQATHIVALSRTAASEIADLAPRYAHKIRIIYCGLGQVGRAVEIAKAPGKLVLIGSGPHKRNEQALEALMAIDTSWPADVVGINLSGACRRIAARAHGARSITFKAGLSQKEFMAELGSAEYYMSLGVDEGFGLPYVEALALGCQVIAIDQPLTRELIEGGAILLANGTTAEISEQLGSVEPIAAEDRLRIVHRYSWEAAAREVKSCICEAIG